MPNKMYAPKPARGPREAALGLMPDNVSRANYKAQVLAGVTLPRRFIVDGVTVTVIDGPTLRTADNGVVVLSVWIQAERGGIALSTDNPYEFVNPPIKSHDGTWRLEQDEKGNTVDVPNTGENPLRTLQRIIVDAVTRNGKL